MMKKYIHEVIVVEGRHDTERLKKYYECDTIETGGTSLDNDVIHLIQIAKEKRGVIIFTDPDSPGNRIRNEINRRVPGCKNAFIDRKNARTEKKVGVEHAAYHPIDEALSNLMTYDILPEGRVTMQDMYMLGLTGKRESAQLRRKTGEFYHIGDGTAKTMMNRLNCIGITADELKETVKRWKS